MSQHLHVCCYFYLARYLPEISEKSELITSSSWQSKDSIPYFRSCKGKLILVNFMSQTKRALTVHLACTMTSGN